MKIECIGLEPDRERNARRVDPGGARWHTLAAARGLLRCTWSLIDYLPIFMIFAIKFPFEVEMCLPHTCFPI
jgi:hypothetical protein